MLKSFTVLNYMMRTAGMQAFIGRKFYRNSKAFPLLFLASPASALLFPVTLLLLLPGRFRGKSLPSPGNAGMPPCTQAMEGSRIKMDLF
jgi:hypothetical protein